ncbi:MAG: hypothetical protein ACPL5I_06490 [Thermodesulfobacteriota bacterium]
MIKSVLSSFQTWVGLVIIMGAEVLLFAGNSFVAVYFTPLVWSGYIIFIDSLIYHQKGTSLLQRPKELLLMLPLSILFWLIFEFYNFFIKNWYYVGLPTDLLYRGIGYAWAFATIWPAILLTAEAVQNFSWISRRRIKPLGIKRNYLYISLAVGIFCLVIPLIVSEEVAHYLAAPVWLGFIFLLEPINYWMGKNSLFLKLAGGDPRPLYSLLLSGFICGILWEFWNYWAGAKWRYSVPILGDIKVFEMPILGYLGFPPFAIECYTMYYFVKNLLIKAKVLPESNSKGI